MIPLYQKYRPKTLKGVIGQDGSVVSLQMQIDKKKVPHVVLLTGPSGCGKTTIGRILKEHLECGDGDFFEINCADFKGIDMVRDIRRAVGMSPMHGSTRVWLIDEAGKLTNDAQNALLKLLEDTPSHAYFLLATTDPQKLIKTIHTRAAQVKLSAITHKDLELLIQRVANKEGMSISGDIISEIADAADGSARKALVILEQVGTLETEAEQLKAIQTSTFNKDEAINLARALFDRRGTPWPEIARILRNLSDQDAEGIRYCVLGYARSCLIGKEDKPPNMQFAEKAFRVIDIFSANFYDSKHAGLAAACWEVVTK